MTLIEDIKKWYSEESYPPSGEDLGDGAEMVHSEYGESMRWGIEVVNVYRRGEDYVAVSDVEPATEMQSWGDYGEPDIYWAEPVTVSVTKYVKKV